MPKRGEHTACLNSDEDDWKGLDPCYERVRAIKANEKLIEAMQREGRLPQEPKGPDDRVGRF